jgi:hypothetical protein
MTHLLVRHQVADFEKWKPVYDDHLAARQKAGLRETNLLRSINNPIGFNPRGCCRSAVDRASRPRRSA